MASGKISDVVHRLMGRDRCRKDDVIEEELPASQQQAVAAVHLWSERAPRPLGGAIRVADLGGSHPRLHESLIMAESALSIDYVRYDLLPRHSAVSRRDLEREMPTGRADVAFALGGLEYLRDLAEFLRWLRTYADVAVFSYVTAGEPLTRKQVRRRRARGWRTDHTRAAILAVAARSGYRTLASEEDGRGNVVVLCSADSPLWANGRPVAATGRTFRRT